MGDIELSGIQHRVFSCMHDAKRHKTLDFCISVMFETKYLMISVCQVCIPVLECVCILHVRRLRLMKIVGDPEISPICGALWSSLFPVSPCSLCLSLQIWLWGRLAQMRCQCTGTSLEIETDVCHIWVSLFTCHLWVSLCFVRTQVSGCCVCGSHDDADSKSPQSWWSAVSPASDWYHCYMVKKSFSFLLNCVVH